MNNLLNKIHQQNATAFTHSGKFHADDVFSAALLLYLNPEITILRGNRVPEEFAGIVFDIGRGRYDHHQKDSRVRENGIAFSGRNLVQKFSEKNWRINSMNPLCSHWTTMITPVRKTSLRH